jgi:transposase-like protein
MWGLRAPGVHHLTPEQRKEALRLRCVEGMTVADLAKRFHISTSQMSRELHKEVGRNRSGRPRERKGLKRWKR